jgi:hypothetical protein
VERADRTYAPVRAVHEDARVIEYMPVNLSDARWRCQCQFDAPAAGSSLHVGLSTEKGSRAALDRYNGCTDHQVDLTLTYLEVCADGKNAAGGSDIHVASEQAVINQTQTDLPPSCCTAS